MLNRYPLWKYLLILVVAVIGIFYALPNLFPEQPAIQISRDQGEALSLTDLQPVLEALKQSQIGVMRSEIQPDGNGLIRLTDINEQLHARNIASQTLGKDYTVALNLANATPNWLQVIGAWPMKLGLDLRGGVHFTLSIDMQSAIEQRLNSDASAIRQLLREQQIRYRANQINDHNLQFTFASNADLQKARQLITRQYPGFDFSETSQGRAFILQMRMTDAAIKELADYAVNQNLTTLRNRVNELGVSEPIVQRQGPNRIVVELPGVQDTAAAKRIVGATANLEFRLAALPNTPTDEQETIPFRDDPSQTAAVMRNVIITGDHVSNASTSFGENGRPQVNINLDGAGGAIMNQATRPNIGRGMAVIFIEHRAEPASIQSDSNAPIHTHTERSVISLAQIQSVLGSQFRITGLRSTHEAQELSLLLRSGSLAAPIYFTEERTIGPSLGQQNINRGITSVVVALVLLLIFMLFRYKAFGVIAIIALIINLILLIAILSILGATLTLPGIAGIMLTLAMAVDGNVLIYERIREELRIGLPIQQAIHAGYDRALTSILDSQLTTLLVGIILFSIGTGPVQGFAITLSIGIITSVFTSVTVSRAFTNLAFGGRVIKNLWI